MKITNVSSEKKTIEIPNRDAIVVPANGEIEMDADISTIVTIQRAILASGEIDTLKVTDIDTSVWGVK